LKVACHIGVSARLPPLPANLLRPNQKYKPIGPQYSIVNGQAASMVRIFWRRPSRKISAITKIALAIESGT
jgi:hypothetical protein